jgi:PQQ-dependent catabolism-associated CXXCW motif protein
MAPSVPPSRRGILATGLLLLAAAPDAPPSEPPGLWSGPMQGAVPATLAGATVLPTAEAANAFLTGHRSLPIDVAAAPERPDGMAPGLPWLPPARQDIPGSIWLPGAGQAVLQPDRADAYLGAVGRRTGNDPNRFVMVYCHRNCWAGWNAAKRLVQAGYSHVAWFPPGIEGWAGADLPLERTEPTPY